MPTWPKPYPRANPECSTSHAAETFLLLLERGITGNSESLASARFFKSSCCSSDSTGFLKNDPALRQSGSPSTISMPLRGANVTHGFARLSEIGQGLASFEVTLQVGVFKMRLAAWSERIGDAQNDEASALAWC